MCQFSQWTGERKLIWLTNVKSREKEYPTSGMKCPSWSVLCSYLLRTLCPVVCVNGCSVCFITELSWTPTRLRCREGDTLPQLEVTAAPSLCQAGEAGMGRCWESPPWWRATCPCPCRADSVLVVPFSLGWSMAPQCRVRVRRFTRPSRCWGMCATVWHFCWQTEEMHGWS